MKFTTIGLLWVTSAGLFAPFAASNAAAIARCSAAALPTGQQNFAVSSSGRARNVLLSVPPASARGRALPLLIDLHGSSGNSRRQASESALSKVGEKHGFVVANPDGGIALPGEPDAHYWNIPGVPLTVGATPADAADDMQFIADLIDQLVATGCVDARRVYVTGMSGGARMTSLLACRLSTRIAAVAPVAGLRAGLPGGNNPPLPDPATCEPARPMPIVTFHGTGDQVNPYGGGGPPYWGYGVDAALQRWVTINRCSPTPRERRVAAHVTSVSYRRCAGGAEVLLYRINATAAEGGGHTWPGSTPRTDNPYAKLSPPTQEISASELMWQFLKRYRLP